MLNQVIYENKEITSWCLSELITQTRNIFALAGYKGPLIETVEFSNTINKEVKLAKNGSSQFIFFVAVLCFSIIHLAMRTNNQTPFYMYTWISSDALVEELQSNGSQRFTIESERLYSQVLPIFKKSNNL